MDAGEGGGASRTTEPAAGSSAATDVSIREFLGREIWHARHEGRLLFAGVALFAAYAWSEVQRRLTNLNHEAERIQHAQDSSVSADTYQANEQQRDKESDALGEWRKEVDRDRTQSVSRAEFNRDTRVEKRSGIDVTTKVIATVLTTAILMLGILNYLALHHDTPVPTVTVTVPTKGATP